MSEKPQRGAGDTPAEPSVPASRAQTDVRTRLEDVIRGTRAGTWEWNVQTGEVIFNERWAEIIGETLDGLGPVSLRTWLDRAHPGDVATSDALLARHFAGELKYYETEVRMRHRDGHWVWVQTRGRVVSWTDDGAPLWMAGTHIDVTEQKEALCRLQESETLYRLAQQATGVGIWDWNITDDVIHWDAPSWAMLGFPATAAALDYARWKAMLHPDDVAKTEAAVQRHLAVGGDFIAEFRCRTVDGGWLWVQGRGQVVERDATGTPRRMLGTHTRIQEARQAQETLRTFADRLRKLTHHLPGVLYQFRLDPDGQTAFPYASDGIRHIYGCAPEDVAEDAAAVFAVLHPDDAADVRASVAESARTLTRWEAQYRVRHPEKGVIWVEGQATPEPLPGGAVLWHGYISEVSERRRLEQQLARGERVYQSIFDNVSDAVFLVERDSGAGVFRCVHANYARTAAMGDAGSAIPPDREHHFARCVETRAPVLFEEEVGTPGTRLTWATQLTPILDEGGDVTLIVAISRDITALKSLQAELTRSNAELEHFAFAVSHDLRQPLRMITSYCQLVERTLADRLSGRAAEFMTFVRDGAVRMDEMLLALLEYSRVGRHGEPAALQPSGALIEEALRYLQPMIRERDAVVVVPDALPDIVFSRDEGVRLFQNLIGNALKYVAPGRTPRVDIGVKTTPSGHAFTITDNGIGIDPAQIPRLFKVFQRLHTREEYDGTGIGLALCRRIVEHHGGHIRIDSDGERRGCTVTVTVPSAGAAPST